MSPHEALQASFATALLDPEQSAPAAIADRANATERFAIYRNNVVKGLCDALADTFPVVRQLVGDRFFEAMAREFILVQPPASPVLLEYGHGFASFLETFPPVATLPYLADVARIERAWLDAYHAAETPRFDASGPTITAEAMAERTPLLHPSLQICRVSLAAFDIWNAHVSDGEMPDMAAGDAWKDIMIVRPDHEVDVLQLLPGEVEFIQALKSGHNISLALEYTASAFSEFDIASTLNTITVAGVITGFEPIGKISYADI